MKFWQHSAITNARSNPMRADPRQIKIMPGFNIRDMNSASTKAHIAELKELIRNAPGVQTALELRIVDEDIYVTHGHCRLIAVMELIEEGVEIATVPVVSEPFGINDAARDDRQRMSNTGKGHEPLENAEYVRRQLGYGFEPQQIADKNNWTLQTVKNLIAMLEMPAETQQKVRAGEVSATLALQVTRQEGERAPEILEAAKEEAKKAKPKTDKPRGPKVTLKAVKRVATSKAGTAARGKEDALLDFANVADKAQSYAQMDGGTPNPEHAQEIVTELGAALEKAKGKGIKPAPAPAPASVPGGMNGHANKNLLKVLAPFAEYCEAIQDPETDPNGMIQIRAGYVFDAAAAYRAATGGENG